MNTKQSIEHLEYIKSMCEFEPEAKKVINVEAIDVAIEALKNKNACLRRILSNIKLLYDNESDEIEKLPEDLDHHIWIRRGLILSQQVIQKEMDS